MCSSYWNFLNSCANKVVDTGMKDRIRDCLKQLNDFYVNLSANYANLVWGHTLMTRWCSVINRNIASDLKFLSWEEYCIMKETESAPSRNVNILTKNAEAINLMSQANFTWIDGTSYELLNCDGIEAVRDNKLTLIYFKPKVNNEIDVLHEVPPSQNLVIYLLKYVKLPNAKN